MNDIRAWLFEQCKKAADIEMRQLEEQAREWMNVYGYSPNDLTLWKMQDGRQGICPKHMLDDRYFLDNLEKGYLKPIPGATFVVKKH